MDEAAIERILGALTARINETVEIALTKALDERQQQIQRRRRTPHQNETNNHHEQNNDQEEAPEEEQNMEFDVQPVGNGMVYPVTGDPPHYRVTKNARPQNFNNSMENQAILWNGG